jgi:hypothetical protein
LLVLAAKRLNQITRKPAHSPPPLFLSRRCRELPVEGRVKPRLSVRVHRTRVGVAWKIEMISRSLGGFWIRPCASSI